MWKRIAAVTMMAVAAVNIAGRAAADTYSYICKVKPHGTTNLIVNETKMTLTWNGKVYKIKRQMECAKYGWRAQKNGERSFNFCTMTQGYADIEFDDGETVEYWTK